MRAMGRRSGGRGVSAVLRVALVVALLASVVTTALVTSTAVPPAAAQLLDGDIDLSVCASVLSTATTTTPATCTIPTNIGNISILYEFDGPGPAYIDGFGDIPDGGHFSGGDITVSFEDPVENFSLDFFHLNHTREYFHNFSIAPDNVDTDGDGNGTNITYIPNFDENDPFNDNGLLTGPSATWDFARLTWNGPLTEVSFSLNRNAGTPFTSLDATNGLRFPGGAAVIAPELSISKTTNDDDGNVSPGEALTYTVAVENTGSAPMTDVSVTDVLPAGVTYVAGSTVATSPTKSLNNGAGPTLVSGDPSVGLVDPLDDFDLAEGETLTVTYDVTVNPDASGLLVNAAVGDSVETDPGSAVASLTVIQNEPAVDLVKSLASNFDDDASGSVTFDDLLQYEFLVTNTGNMVLDPVTVTDPLITDVVCPAGPLAPGTNVACTGSYRVSGADSLAGEIINTATATGVPPSGVPVDSPPSTVTTVVEAVLVDCPAQQNIDPYVNGARSATGNLGDGTPFSMEATNGTANVFFTTGFASFNGTSQLFSSSTIYTPPAPSTDVAALRVTGAVGTAGAIRLNFGLPVVDPVISVNNFDWTAFDFAPTVDIDGTPIDASKITILSGNDDLLLVDTVLSDATVGTGENPTNNPTDASRSAYGTVQLTGTYSQIDFDLTKITRLGDTVLLHVALDGTCSGPGVSLVKNLASNTDEDGTSTVTEGDTLTYSFLVRNAGTGELQSVVVNDPTVGAVSCPITTLASTESTTCTGTYVVTAADVAAGQIVNTATAVGSPPGLPPVASDPATVVTPVAAQVVVCPSPNLVSNGDFQAGAASWTEGHNLDSTSGPVSFPSDSFETSPLSTAPFGPSGPRYFQSFVDNDGNLDPSGGNVQLVNDVPIAIENGSNYTFSFDIREFPDFAGLTVNGAELKWVLVDQTTNEIVPSQAPLYVMETEDPDRRGGLPLVPPQWDQFVANFTATAPTGSYKLGLAWDVYADPSSPTELVTDIVMDRVYLGLSDCSIDVTKTVSPTGPVVPGQTLTYTVVVENTGSGTVTDVTVADTLPAGVTYVGSSTVATSPAKSLNNGAGPALVSGEPDNILVDVFDDFDLAGGESLTVTYDVTVDAGAPDTLTNAAVGDSAETAPESASATVAVVEPSIALTKSLAGNADEDVSGNVTVGDTLSYEFLVTNNGDLPLTAVGITDDKVGAVACPQTTLGVDESITCTADYTVLPADVLAGEIVNTATASATPPSGPAITSPDSTVITPVIENPSLTIDKSLASNADEDGSTTVTVGDTLTYEYVVTNSGDVTLDPVTVSDDRIATVTCPAGPLPATNSTTCTATYVVVTGDAEAGSITNIAFATGTSPTGNPVDSPTDTETVNVIANPALTVTKSVASNADEDGSTDVTVGDTLTYEFLIDNTGDVTLDPIVVNDDQIATVTCPVTSLAPAGTTTCTGTYVVSAADVAAGQVVNIATATGTPPNGPPVSSPPSQVTTPIVANPGISITKSLASNADEDASTDVSSGDTLTYEFEVTNSGDVPLDPIVVNDDKVPAVTCPVTSLAPTTSTTCSGDYVVVDADAETGEVVNTATATGTPPNGVPITSPPSAVTTPVVAQPAVSVTKSLAANADEDGSTTVTEDDTLTYEFEVTNDGDVSLDPIVVNDANVPAVTCPVTALAAGASTICSGDYTVTRADVLAGEVINEATATGTPPNDPPVTSPPSQVTTPVAQDVAIEIVKSLASNADEDASADITVDDTLTYEFEVTNTGDVALTTVVVNDDNVPTVTCPVTTLLPGESTTCSGPYVVVQADVLAGQILNSATATGTPPVGGPVTSAPSDVLTPVPQEASITVVKSLASNADEDGSGDVTLDDTLTYEFLVENTGDLSLDPISVTDSLIPGVTCPVTTLAPAATTTCSGDYVVLEADVIAGEVVNTATATGTPPADPPVTSPPSEVTTPVEQNASFTVTKSLFANADEDGSGDVTFDDTLTYNFEFENTGDVTLSNISVTDSLIPGVTCPVADLAPGASTTCTADYTVTLADVAAGQVVNEATGGAEVPPSVPPPPVPPPSQVITPVGATPSISVAKTLASNVDQDGSTDVSLADTLNYEFLVENTGDIVLDPVVVNDSLIPTVTCPVTSLAVGATTICIGSYSVTVDDVAAGEVVNTATATGTPPTGAPVTSAPSQVTTPIVQNPEVSITKSLSSNADEDGSGDVSLGDTLTYSFQVNNIGDVPLTDVVVTDAKVPGVLCTSTSLPAPGTTTCTGNYTVTLADVAAGETVNSATATGTPPSGPPVTSTPSEVTTPVSQNAALTVAKSLGSNADEDASGTVTADDTLTYEFEVANTGDVPLDAIVVNDDNVPTVTCPVTTLAPGVSTVCSGDYVVLAADIEAGEIVNTATATGTPPDGTPIDSPPSTITTPTDQSPELTFTKSLGVNADEDGSTTVTEGDTLTYNFLVENTGNVTISNVAVSDALIPAVGCPLTVLAPGETMTCTGDYVVTLADVEAGEIVNDALVTGDPPPGGPPLPPTPPEQVITPTDPQPELIFTKSVGSNADEDGSTTVTAGDTLTYNFLVENTGNVTISGVVVTDPLPGLSPISCPATVVAPGESTTCTATKVVSTTDANAGQIVNTASVTGDPPPTSPPLADPPPSTVTTPVEQAPAIDLVKSFVVNADENGNGVVDLDDTVTYQFDVTNNGDVDITDIVINDPTLSLTAFACDAGPLAPTETATCTADYSVTQQNVDDLQIENTATATGTPPSGTPIDSPPNTVTIDINLPPTIALDKTLASNADEDGSGDVSAGDTLTYQFDVENNGPLTLNAVTVSDDLIATVTCAPDPANLAPGESAVCTGTYVVTQDDVNVGQIINTATATGTPLLAPPPTSPPDIETTPITQTPELTITKSLGANADEDGSGDVSLGDTLTYEFLAENSGNLSLTGVTVVDSLPGLSAITCPTTALEPAETTTCSATYTVTQDNVDAGEVVNGATGGANPPPNGPPLPPVPQSQITTPIPQDSELEVVKSLAANADEDGTTTVTLGDTLTYSFEATNNGNVSLDILTINDDKVPTVICLVTMLDPGDSTTCTGTYVVTSADVAAGEVVNRATATGTPPNGPPIGSPPSEVTTGVEAQPSMTVTKSVGSNADEDGSTDVTVDDTLTYEFVVENTGDVVLDNLVVDDTLIPTVTCAVTTLQPGFSTTCRADYVVTAADVEAGQIINTATTTGEPPNGPPVTSPPSEVTTPVEQNPGLSIVKSVAANADEDGSTTITLNDTLTYEFLVENTGDVTVDNIAVNDPQVPGATCPVTTLVPGAATTCTVDYVVTLGDVQVSEVVNAATVTGDPPPGGPPLPPVPPSTVTTPINANPSLTVTKTLQLDPDPSDPVDVVAGDILIYEFFVENTGDVQITDLVVTDALIPNVTCPVTTIDIGISTTCLGDYVVTQADVDAGEIVNTATVTGTPPNGPPLPPSPPSEVTTPVTQNPSMTVAKSVAANADEDGSGDVSLGDTLTYEFVVENTGDVTITGIAVDDAKVPGATCPVTSLAAGESTTCAGDYVVTLADVDAGEVVNSATITGDPPPGGPPLPPVPPSEVTTPVEQNPSMTVAKSVAGNADEDGSGDVSLGDTLTYEFVVENTGDVTITGIAVDDAKVPGAACPVTSLAAGESTTCAGDYVVTLADVDASEVVNSATITGDPPPGGPPLPPVPPSEVTTPVEQNPSMTVAKSVAGNADEDGSGDVSLGDTLTYEFVVENTGDVTITGIAVDDAKVPGATCPVTSLASGESTTCAGDYVVTLADVDAGEVVNSATITGDPPPGGPPLPPVPPSVVTSPVADNPALTTAKSVAGNADEDGSGDVSLGDTLTYEFVVENTGDVELTDLVVNDSQVGAVTCPTTTLPVGDTTTCTADYIVTVDDADGGEVINTATTTGTPPNGPPVTSPPSEITTPVSQNPALTIAKSVGDNLDADASTTVTVGDTLTYEFLVENAGNVTITGVAVVDDMPGLSPVTCPSTVLAPGESTTCSATKVVDTADANNGEIVNSATITGDPPPTGPPLLLPPPSVVTTPIEQNPELSVVKSFAVNADEDGSGDLTVNDTLTYQFDVTNTGDVDLISIVINDAKLSANPIACAAGPVAPAASVTCTAEYVVTQTDIDAGEIVNDATATGTPPDGTPVDSPPSQVTVDIDSAATIAIDKSLGANADEDGSADISPNDTLTYNFEVLNNGPVTLANVTVNDDLIAAVTCAPTTLAPGETASCTGDYVVTLDDVDAGQIVNTATAQGEPPTGPAVTSPPDTETTDIARTPELTITKSLAGNADEDGSTTITAGDTLTYNFEAANTGNVTITGVTVIDALPGLSAISCPTTTLTPGQTMTCFATYSVTQADLDAGEVVNSATGGGNPPPGGPPLPPVPPSEVTTDIPPAPELEVAKSVGANADEDGSTTVTAGDTLTYNFVASNLGNVTLNGLVVNDDLIATVTCPTTTLEPNDSVICTGEYVVTDADIDAGEIVNSATVTGTPPSGPPFESPPSEVTTPTAQNPGLTFTKSLGTNADEDGSTTVTEGDTLNYEFLVENTGNVTISNIVVTDILIPVVTCPATTLAAGESTTCTGSYVVTLSDIEAGEIVNDATVTGDPPPGGPPLPPVPPSQEVIPSDPDPELTFTKSVGANADEDGSTTVTVGDTLTYNFLVENTGNVTITGITVVDDMPGLSPVACPSTVLAPGASTTCTAIKVVATADANAGEIVNSATVVGDPPPGTPPLPPVPPSEVTTGVEATPSISLVKSLVVNADEDGSGSVTVNDTLTYQFDVTNDGDVDITDVVIDDPNLGIVFTCDTGPVAPGESVTCTAEYTVIQSDVDATQIVNAATATGTPPSGPPLDSPPSTVTTIIDAAPTVSVDKSLTSNADEDGSSTVTVGDTLTYGFAVLNNGPLTITSVSVDDDLIPAVACAAGSLAPGETTTCTGQYLVTQDDVDAGQIINTAIATGPTVNGPPAVSPPDRETTPITQISGMTVTKSLAGNADEDGSTTVTVGDTLTYNFLAENTGNVTLTGVTVVDALPGLSATSCPASVLAPAATTLCTATYTVTQEDVDAGEIVNSATGGANPPPGVEPPRVPPTEITTEIPQTTSLEVAKSVADNADEDGSGDVSLGDTLTYNFVATNTGSTTITDLSVADDKVPLVICLVTTLEPGASATCTGNYQVTTADADAGEVVNSATITGTPPDGPPLTSPPSEVTTEVEQNPSLEVAKSVGDNADEDGSGDVSLGDTLTYEFLVENTGDVTITGIAVDDAKIPATTCPTTTLAARESTTCQGDYVVTAADVGAGEVVNSATITGDPPPGGPPLPPVPPSEVTTSVRNNSGMTVEKSVGVNADEDGSGDISLADTLTYEFVIVNTGDVPIDDIVVNDALVGAVACPFTSLGAGESMTCAASYVVTLADVAAGQVVNSATVTGTPPGGPPLTSPPSVVTSPVGSNARLTVTKSVGGNADEDGSGDVTLGDTLTYTFLAVNAGDVAIGDLGVNDALIADVTCPVATLAPGASTTCSGTLVVSSTHSNAGEITNVATVSGTPPGGPPVTSPPSEITTTVGQNPALTLVKSVGANADEDGSGTVTAGDTLTYDFVVTNTGDVTITNVVVSDALVGGVACPMTSLVPGAAMTCGAGYTVTAADVEAGEIVNSATVAGDPPPGSPPLPPPPASEITTAVEQAAMLGVAKSVSSGPVSNGDGSFTATYTIVVLNTGDVTITDVVVTDDLATAFAGAQSFTLDSTSGDTALLDAGISLAPGEGATVLLTVTIVPGSNAGPYDNSAVAAGQSALGVVSDQSDSGSNADPNNANAGAPGDSGGTNDSTPITFDVAPAPTAVPTVQPSRPQPTGPTGPLVVPTPQPLFEVQPEFPLLALTGGEPLGLVALGLLLVALGGASVLTFRRRGEDDELS